MQHQITNYSLREIIRLVRSGRMAVPEFQRDFVWEPDQVADLLDSVANGWPIGSLLVLDGPQPFGVKAIEGGPQVDADAVLYYLLDGQQRVSALFHGLTGAGPYAYYVDATKLDESEEAPFQWVRRDDASEHFARHKNCIPLHDFLDAEKFASLTRKMSSPRATRLAEGRKRRLGYLLNGGYDVPAIVMDRGIALEALTRIFETLNRTGVRLDAFDLMVAVLYPGGFHLRDKWNEAVEDSPILKEMGADGLEVLKVIALYQRQLDRDSNSRPISRRVTGVRQRDVLNIPAESVIKNWPRAVLAYVQALELLRSNFGVESREDIPSWGMLLTLASLIEAGWPANLISRWYWMSVFLQSYAQGANTQVLADLDNFPEVAQRSVSLSDIRIHGPLRRNKILRLGLRGLMRLKSALDPITGDPVRGPLVEVPLLPVIESADVHALREETALEVVYMSPQSYRQARVRARRRELVRLNDAALESQGLPESWIFHEEPTTAILQRQRTILQWIEERL